MACLSRHSRLWLRLTTARGGREGQQQGLGQTRRWRGHTPRLKRVLPAAARARVLDDRRAGDKHTRRGNGNACGAHPESDTARDGFQFFL